MKIFNSLMEFLGFEKVQVAEANRGRGGLRWRWRRGRGRRVPGKTVVNDKPIEYVLNDMSTPNLMKVVPTPTPPASPKFAVKNFQGGGFARGSAQSQAANCYVTVANTLNYLQHRTDKPLQRWAGTSTLVVIPRKGQDLNAYYDRRSLSFFYFSHKAVGGNIFTADSSEIVAHELGHAILDSYRPDTWGAASLEVWSFHEAFADLTAMMNTMFHREVIAHAVNQTGGDLRKPNVISNLAEHVGQAIYRLTGPKSGRNPQCLRSAINYFKYVNPGSLPKEAPANKLAAECHSFGRIFLGAFYDILVMMYEDVRSRGNLGPIDSLIEARNTLAQYTMKAIQNAPINVRFYESMAKTLLWADVTLNNRKYHDRMMKIFMDRNLMRPQLKMLSAPECDSDDLILKTQSKFNLKLGDHLIRAQSNNPLYDVEVEIPHDSVFLYDNNRNLVDSIACTDDEALMGGQDMINYLWDAQQVNDTEKTPFAVENGKLIRTHFE